MPLLKEEYYQEYHEENHNVTLSAKFKFLGHRETFYDQSEAYDMKLKITYYIGIKKLYVLQINKKIIASTSDQLSFIEQIEENHNYIMIGGDNILILNNNFTFERNDINIYYITKKSISDGIKKFFTFK